ncbi:MAG: hypothetical protein ACI8RZ_002220 [Myxococcota bacterium]|jgi:hypothetical protein
MSPAPRPALTLVWLLLWSGVSACSVVPLSDLRPDGFGVDGISAESEALGRAVLAQAAEAHGGATWGEHQTWQTVLEDRWSKDWLIARRSPWPDDVTMLQLQFSPGTSNGRVEFLDGSIKGTAWGFAEGRTYAQAPGEAPVWDEAPRMASRLPTMQFLLEFPQQITRAQFVGHIGQRQVDGHTTEVVFASWGSIAPDPTFDQFLVYVDTESHHILAMQYTVRKSGRTLLGHRFWSDLRTSDGVLLPFFQTSLHDFEDGDPVHSFIVSDFSFDTVSAESLADPDQSRD